MSWEHTALFVVGAMFVGAFAARWVFEPSASVSAGMCRGGRIGSYELVRLFATGGMGEIWTARHTSLGRAAAIKVLQSDLLKSASRRRRRGLLVNFEQEARRMAALRSPHTVQLYDFGRTCDGALFYAMELLGGLNLEQLVARFGPQPPGRVIWLLRQACGAIGEAHAAGLIHRDIKSANLQLTICGNEYDFLKVLDYGLATTSLSGLRQANARFVEGTPAYVAPEAARFGTRVDARADLYSLGCVAYELLTGRLVFEGATSSELLLAHAERTPVPPSAFVPISAELERLVMRLLEKDPDRRPQTASELEARLAALARRTPWSQADAVLWWHSHLPEMTALSQRDIEARAFTAREPTPVPPSPRAGRNTIPARNPNRCSSDPQSLPRGQRMSEKEVLIDRSE
jgi:serine/threonine-protein kinase